MELVGLESTDIRLDGNGQPAAAQDGDFKTISGVPCWMQDIKNETLTQEGELFYEDDIDTDAYGFSMADFIQAEYDEFTEMEINQRIKEKLQKRGDVDEGTIQTEIGFDGKNYHCNVAFKINDSNEEYNLDLDTDKAEVIADD